MNYMPGTASLIEDIDSKLIAKRFNKLVLHRWDTHSHSWRVMMFA